jgi:hypothetical protein
MVLTPFQADKAPVKPVRKPSFDQQALDALEKRLSARPEKSELVDRNILKGMQRPYIVFKPS